MNRAVLVTGAAGYLGTHVCTRLLAEGYCVRGLIRPEDSGRLALSDGVQFYRGSVASAEVVRLAAAGMDAVVNCASVMPDRSGRIPWEVYRETNVEGGKVVLDAAAYLGIERVILISTAGVLEVDPRDRTANDESSLRKGHNHYLRSKIDFERWLHSPEGPLYPNWIVMRPSSLLGPGVSFKWPQVAELTRAGKARIVGEGRALHPLVHVADVADAIFKALTCPIERIRRQRITISSSQEISVGDTLRILAEYYGRPMPQRIPYALVLMIAYALGFFPRTWLPERLRLLTPGALEEYAQDRRYDLSKAQELLGFRAERALEEGLKETLSFLESRGSN